MSHLTLGCDPISNAPYLRGSAYSLDAKPVAEWNSTNASFVLSKSPEIYYRWEGDELGARGEKLGGHGIITFNDHEEPESAKGHFFDANFSEIKQGVAPTREKNFRLYPLSSDDTRTMQRSGSPEALAIISFSTPLPGQAFAEKHRCAIKRAAVPR